MLRLLKMDLWKKNTPAKEYGITENKWTLTKLLNYRCSKISTN